MTKKLLNHTRSWLTITLGFALGVVTGFVGLVIEPIWLFSAGMVPADDPLRQSWKYPVEKMFPVLLVALLWAAFFATISRRRAASNMAADPGCNS